MRIKGAHAPGFDHDYTRRYDKGACFHGKTAFVPGVTAERRKRAVVAVLGDLGRSPRMQLHALALAKQKVDVRLVGLGDSPVFPAVEDAPGIEVRVIGGPASARPRGRAGFLLSAALRAATLAVRFAWTLLFRGPKPDLILVQTPPSVPTLAVALLAARIRGARLVIDWHNFGWSMLGLKLGADHPAVRLVRGFERVFGRRGDLHLCVSKAMARRLGEDMGVGHAHVLHDLPPVIVPAVSFEQRRRQLAEVAGRAGLADLFSGDPPRPLVVSSTSWSLDEDFALLLDAARRYDADADRHGGPDLVVVITGKGPLRAGFERRVACAGLRRVTIRTAWLSEPDYRSLLAAADLGLSLHRSASGVDLAMKVSDMQGAGLPVCALDYGSCLREQVRPGDNGITFSDGPELARHLATVLAGFPGDTVALDRLRAATVHARGETWEENWRRVVKPVLLGG